MLSSSSSSARGQAGLLSVAPSFEDDHCFSAEVSFDCTINIILLCPKTKTREEKSGMVEPWVTWPCEALY